jgi:hypothetical protein
MCCTSTYRLLLTILTAYMGWMMGAQQVQAQGWNSHRFTSYY